MRSGSKRGSAVGHSWGAFLALQLLVAHPERLLGVVCANRLGDEEVARVDEVEELRRRGDASEADLVERFAILWPQHEIATEL